MKTFDVLTPLLALLLLSSCSASNENDEGIDKGSQGLVPILLTEKLTGTTVSRAGTGLQGAQIANGTLVGVCAYANTTTVTSAGYGYINAPYTADDSGGLTVGAIKVYYPAAGGTVDIYAYAPYSSFAPTDLSTTALSFSVNANQSTDANYIASDLLCAAPLTEKASTAEAQALTFAHKLSKITVKLGSGGGISDDNLKSSTITLKNTLPTTTLNVKSNTITPASGTAADITVKAAGTSTSASAIIVPQTLAAGKQFIAVAIGSMTYYYTIPTGGITFAASNEYTYTITVNATGISVSSTITNWTSTTISGTAAQQ